MNRPLWHIIIEPQEGRSDHPYVHFEFFTVNLIASHIPVLDSLNFSVPGQPVMLFPCPRALTTVAQRQQKLPFLPMFYQTSCHAV